MRTFKIQRFNEETLIVQGELIADATGSRYYVQVIRTEARSYLLVVGDYIDDWQIVYQPSGHASLQHILRSFVIEPPPETVRAIISGWPASPRVRRDLIGTASSAAMQVWVDYLTATSR